jgi:zinc transport system substrate-binding protein
MSGRLVYVVAAVLVLLPCAAGARPPQVVATIKPVHSLVAAVMAGVGEPQLLLEGGMSPHRLSLRPSQARALEAAEVVFWVGEGLESALAEPLATLPRHARVIALDKARGLHPLAVRDDGLWMPRDHAEHGPGGAGHDDHGGHGHTGIDPHIWLDPVNAIAIADTVAAALAQADPANAARYQDNRERLTQRLRALHRQLEARLALVANRPYVVFHDAYQYLEHRYDLSPVGAITLSPERMPGAAHLRSIRERLTLNRVGCVFTEPQFEPALVETVVEGTDAAIGVLDPLGAELEPGPQMYFRLLRALADSLVACLDRP